MDNIERFENDDYIERYESELTSKILEHTNNAMLPINSPASRDKVDLNNASDPKLGAINASDANTGYTSTTGEYLARNNNNSNTDNSDDTCFVRDRLTSSDLLPKDAGNSKWGQINPAGSGLLGDQNFLTAGYHVGINTIGQSLRNANLQLRSEPPNPQVAVSPWGISTIEPDVRAVAFEIGSAPSF